MVGPVELEERLAARGPRVSVNGEALHLVVPRTTVLRKDVAQTGYLTSEWTAMGSKTYTDQMLSGLISILTVWHSQWPVLFVFQFPEVERESRFSGPGFSFS